MQEFFYENDIEYFSYTSLIFINDLPETSKIMRISSLVQPSI